MIYKLTIKVPAKTPVPWVPKVEALAQPRTFEFKPGLNILWGRNGSGKSTLVKLMARLLHCEQGVQPVVTEQSVSTLVGNRFDKVNVEEGVEVIHDGQGVRHFDPGHAVGLDSGAFDWDFAREGLENTMFKGSAGQTTLRRFDLVLNQIIAGVVPEVTWMIKKSSVNEVWQGYIGTAEHFLKGTGKKGPPTVLLDEPERSYDVNTATGLWRVLRAYSTDVQFIVASHSFFALRIPEAHYIELTPGYLEKSVNALDLLQKWPEEKPSKVPKAEATKVKKAIKGKR